MKIKFPKIPTDEHMALIAEDWYKPLEGLTLLDYSDELLKHTFPFKSVKLDNELINLILNIADSRVSRLIDTDLYVKWIQTTKHLFEGHNEVFIKLNSRSPKDYLLNENNFGKPMALDGCDDALDAILSSMRCFDDLCMFKYLDNCHLIVRPYVTFHPMTEFRVFVKEKKIIGISQYYYDNDFGYSKSYKESAERIIREFIDNIVTPNMLKYTFVADVVVGNSACDTTLIETNPFGLSDPCLFTYDTMDGSFKTK